MSIQDNKKCLICDNDLYCSWTDTHGVGQCTSCGAPYRLYFYEDNKRVEREPEILLKEKFIPWCKEYWEQFHKPMGSGHSFPGGQELATTEEHNEHVRFLNKKLELQESK